jgi:hypothetical protein
MTFLRGNQMNNKIIKRIFRFSLFLLMILSHQPDAQISGIDLQLKQRILEQKAIHYSQMLLYEQQLTPNPLQNNPDLFFSAILFARLAPDIPYN